ncbi:MAG: efflux RND transporter periplasmic adaptor subunit [Bacteriovoracaceae bacterium]|nr:efflux RND transporter periplasmic adaptor subunit [Bacteriovoracaceae bacterium]
MKNIKELLNYLKELCKSNNYKMILIIIGCSMALGLFGGLIVGGTDDPHRGHDHVTNDISTSNKVKAEVWTCSMHPNIRESKPGKCPICGMDLIPAETGDDNDEGEGYTVKLSKQAIKLAEIQSVPVKRELLSTEIKVVGKIAFDETRQAHIAAWFPGRIERLFVNYTGVRVNKGDHMVQIYSPEILAAQEELLQAKKAAKNISRSNYSGIRKLTKETVNNVRSKLRLWGFSDKQIKEIEKRKKTSNRMTVYAPVGGVVIKKHVQEGMYVKTGSKIYSIADLSHLWVKLDVYESDIEFIKYGQLVEFYTESSPGVVFKGTISFIDPVLNSKTQTIKVRVTVENKEGKFRPGMFVHAKIFSKVTTDGVVMDESLADKLVCPMHPEILKDKDADEDHTCPVCGMDLVPTTSLGYIKHDHDLTPPLVIPATAPLITGQRAVVYVSLGEGKYVGRQITLGPKVGDHYVVLEGLKENEMVVVNGNFKIDSSAQLMAKPSMMNQVKQKSKKTATALSTASEFKKQLDQVILNYYSIHKALTEDKFKEVSKMSTAFLKSLEQVDMSLLKGEAHNKWMPLLKDLTSGASQLMKAGDITKGREHFKVISDALIIAVESLGTSGKVKTNRFFCPMAFGSGAFWLQESDSTLNPYYGQSMLTCGEKK